MYRLFAKKNFQFKSSDDAMNVIRSKGINEKGGNYTQNEKKE